jgi:hypothetical protein
VVPDISRGSRTYGLLAYLYGPGRREEHTDAHQVASFDGFAPDPGRNPDITLTDLAQVLDLRVTQLGERAPARHVWHCSVRTAPGDRNLTDDEWGQVARRVVHATGIAGEGDPDGCRWIAVRHAADHVHIVATLVRGDLRRPRHHNDAGRAQAECRRIEREWGLRELNAGDRTAAKAPTSAERSKAQRTGHAPRTARELLREAVRRAVAGAADEQEFFARLRSAGLHLKQRTGPSGGLLGYAVAAPGDVNSGGRPIWFSGSKLAPDLSLPKIRQRLTGSGSTPTTCRSAPEAHRRAAAAADRALRALSGADGGLTPALVGVGEVLDALAVTSPASTRTALRDAAAVFERASRWHSQAARADNRALRAAARGILQAGGGGDGAAGAMVLSSLVLVVVAAARWHAARGHAQQAAAARRAAEHLRAAYRAASVRPMSTLSACGCRLSEEVRQRYAGMVAAVLPEYGERMREEAGWAALLATLGQIQEVSLDPVALLEEAVAVRELESADSVSEVLVWRLRRLAKLPPTASGPVSSSGSGRARTVRRPRQPAPSDAAPQQAPRPPPRR